MTEAPSSAGLIASALARVSVLVALCVLGARAGWWQLWVFLGVMILLLAAHAAVIARRHPSLLQVRSRFGPFTQPWDRLIVGVLLASALAVVVVAGLDVLRYRWSRMAPAWTAAGAATFLAGDAIVVWCLAHNPFLAPAVRVQRERGHHVVTTGPYRLVRHPMYLGAVVATAGWPLLLGSWWACVPALAMAGAFVVRAGFEDALLRRDLSGYQEYAAVTTRRLLPGVW